MSIELANNKGYIKKGVAQWCGGTAQTAITAGSGTAINFFQTALINNSTTITATSSSAVTLKAGRAYKISMTAYVNSFNADGSYAAIQLYNNTTSSYFGQKLLAQPVTMTAKESDNPSAVAFITTTADTSISAKAVGGSGTFSVDFYYTSIVIEELEAYLPAITGTQYADKLVINSGESKTTPIDADELYLSDSTAGSLLKRLSWANIKAALYSYIRTGATSAPGAGYIGYKQQSGTGYTNWTATNATDTSSATFTTITLKAGTTYLCNMQAYVDTTDAFIVVVVSNSTNASLVDAIFACRLQPQSTASQGGSRVTSVFVITPSSDITIDRFRCYNYSGTSKSVYAQAQFTILT